MKRESCTNCGHTLTKKNIDLALKEANLPQHELLFFCPSYAPCDFLEGDFECGDTTMEDKTRPAYWRTISSDTPRASGMNMANIVLNTDHSGTIEWSTNGLATFRGVEAETLAFLESIDISRIDHKVEGKLSIGRDGILYYTADLPDYSNA